MIELGSARADTRKARRARTRVRSSSMTPIRYGNVRPYRTYSNLAARRHDVANKEYLSSIFFGDLGTDPVCENNYVRARASIGRIR